MGEESKTNKPLTIPQASAIITGSGVGAGILAMPFLADKVGIIAALLIIVCSFIAVYLLQLMISELAIKCGGNLQIVDVLTSFIKRPKLKKVLTYAFFLLMIILLYSNLTAYISGAAEILYSSLSIPSWLSKILFYIIAALVTFFGLKILGIVENYAIIAMVLVIIAMGIGSLFNIKNSLNIVPSNVKDIFGFIGMAMFAFNSFFNVPQVVQGLENNEKKIRKSLFIGMFNNMIIILIVLFGTLISSKLPITNPCIPGWVSGLGDWAKVIGIIFTLLALLTSYWSASFALRDILKDHTHLNNTICWLMATLPTLALSFIPFTNFSFFLQIAGTSVAIVLVIFAIPGFYIVSKRNNGDTILKWAGKIPFQIYTMLFFIAMGIGNVWCLF